MTFLKTTLLIFTTMAAAGLSLAEPESDRDSQNRALPGMATKQLMAVQRSGEVASTEEQYLSGKVRTQTYKRYVDSFGKPIPESYITEDFSDGSNK